MNSEVANNKLEYSYFLNLYYIQAGGNEMLKSYFKQILTST